MIVKHINFPVNMNYGFYFKVKTLCRIMYYLETHGRYNIPTRVIIYAKCMRNVRSEN